MDSPESPVTSSAETALFQDSPVFSYISNLSPIEHGKAQSQTQGFPEFNIPSVVFKSPQFNSNSQQTFVKRLSRARSPGLSVAKLSEPDEGCKNSVVNDHSEIPEGYCDQFLANDMDMNTGGDPTNSSNSRVDKSEYIDQIPDDITGPGEFGVKFEYESSTRIGAKKAYPASDTPNIELHEGDTSIDASAMSRDDRLVLQCSDQDEFTTEAVQHRGIISRRLQFEHAQKNKVTSNPNLSAINDAKSLTSPSNINTGKYANPTHPIIYPGKNLNSIVNIPKPSGIGLHLNSILNARVNSAPSDMAIMNRVDSLLLDSAPSIPICDESTPCNKRKYDTENDDGEDVYSKSISQKKRQAYEKRTSDGDGCKRCNCKRTKCLKLYCDCFASGVYCAEPCSCQTCLNRPEYEDKVLEARRQIESRDPLAFAPKVVQQPASSFGEGGALFTPSSARHKRGCNCKKSMCLKKYCECYQAKVGCSDGCGCEGCKNVFGQKGEQSMLKDVFGAIDATNEGSDGSFVQNLETEASADVSCHNELRNPHNLTPRTPDFPFANHEKNGSQALLPSPEPGITFAAPSNIIEDDTPEMLKDDPIPLNVVKVRSPNKKRVSPPHGRPLVFGSSSSLGLKTGRKFILKGVPPLVPCVNSKSGPLKLTNDPRYVSGSKSEDVRDGS